MKASHSVFWGAGVEASLVFFAVGATVGLFFMGFCRVLSGVLRPWLDGTLEVPDLEPKGAPKPSMQPETLNPKP